MVIDLQRWDVNYMLAWHWGWMWNTCTGWMELELTLLSLPRTSSSPPQRSPAPTIQPAFEMDISLPFSLLLLFSNFGGKGRGRPKTAGPVRPIRGSTGCQGAAIGWLGGQAASRRAWPHLPQRPPPIRRGPFTPKVPPKTQPTWPSACALTQNARISCFFLQILRARSKF